jgi:hypothetical protein
VTATRRTSISACAGALVVLLLLLAPARCREGTCVGRWVGRAHLVQAPVSATGLVVVLCIGESGDAEIVSSVLVVEVLCGLSR